MDNERLKKISDDFVAIAGRLTGLALSLAFLLVSNDIDKEVKKVSEQKKSISKEV